MTWKKDRPKANNSSNTFPMVIGYQDPNLVCYNPQRFTDLEIEDLHRFFFLDELKFAQQ